MSKCGRANLFARALAAALLATACAGIDRPDNGAALDDIRNGRGGDEVVVRGTVVQVLETSPVLRYGPGSYAGRHERFIIAVRDGAEQDVLVAHNISIAPPAPVSKGDEVIVRGELALDPTGPVIHWTHHDPRFRHQPGFIELNGKMYE